jgi:curved DNA-binding protein CbpA
MNTDALELALALHQSPIQRFTLRDRPLPGNIGLALQLASAMQPQLEEAAARFSESEETILEAVRFYLQQVLFEPGTDAYRILGLAANADTKRIRQHHIWLQRWLHPDRRGEDWEAVFTTKVNWAWQQLRNENSREEYDRTREVPTPLRADEVSDVAIVQAPAWNVAPIGNARRNWPRRIAVGSLLFFVVVLFYIAVSIEDRADPVSFAQKAAETDAPFESEEPTDEQDAPDPVSDDAHTPSDGQAASALAAIDSTESAVDAGSENLPMAERLPAPSGANSEQPALASGNGVRTNGTPASRARQSEMVATTAPGLASLETDRQIAEAPVPSRRKIRKPADRVPVAEANPVGAVSQSQTPAVVATSGLASPGKSAGVDQAEDSVVRADRRAGIERVSRVQNRGVDAAAETEPDTRQLALRANDSDGTQSAAASPDGPERSPEAAPASAVDTLTRFELARTRVRTMVSYFRSTKDEPPEWNDDQGRLNAERERDALHARNSQVDIQRFALDPPKWRVSDTAVALEATYHIDASRTVAESGKFNLDMTWRDGSWKITRIQVLPSP